MGIGNDWPRHKKRRKTDEFLAFVLHMVSLFDPCINIHFSLVHGVRS